MLPNDELSLLIKSKYPVIFVESIDEEYVVSELRLKSQRTSVGQKLSRPLSWPSIEPRAKKNLFQQISSLSRYVQQRLFPCQKRKRSLLFENAPKKDDSRLKKKLFPIRYKTTLLSKLTRGSSSRPRLFFFLWALHPEGRASPPFHSLRE